MSNKALIQGRIADDCCVFCGLHSNIGGGHYFKGYMNKQGNIEGTAPNKGWIFKEHLSGCIFQICFECVKKIKAGGMAL